MDDVKVTNNLKTITSKIASVNDKIAIYSNKLFATMAFFYFCLIFSLLPLKWPIIMPVVQYASSGVLQLVALPLIGVGTILAARESDRAAKEQHDAVIEILDDVRKMIAEVHAIKESITITIKEVEV